MRGLDIANNGFVTFEISFGTMLLKARVFNLCAQARRPAWSVDSATIVPDISVLNR